MKDIYDLVEIFLSIEQIVGGEFEYIVYMGRILALIGIDCMFEKIYIKIRGREKDIKLIHNIIISLIIILCFKMTGL